MTTMQKIIIKINFGENNIYLKPVYIGNVLEELEFYGPDGPSEDQDKILYLIDFWAQCGLSKSLQEIAECGYSNAPACFTECSASPCKHSILKNPSARALAEFINSII